MKCSNKRTRTDFQPDVRRSPFSPRKPGLPGNPGNPVSPGGPLSPFGPIWPTGPTPPLGPTVPVGPFCPTGPCGPWGPGGPERPGDPNLTLGLHKPKGGIQIFRGRQIEIIDDGSGCQPSSHFRRIRLPIGKVPLLPLLLMYSLADISLTGIPLDLEGIGQPFPLC